MQGVSPMGWLWWIGAALVFGILEMLSLDLVLVMFAGGCLAGAVACALGAPIGVQILVAALTSVLLLADAAALPAASACGSARRWSRPTPRRSSARRRSSSRPSRVEGGRVKLNGEVWSARVDAAQAIPPGTEVRVSRIDGATAVVAPCPGSDHPDPTYDPRAARPRVPPGGFMDDPAAGRSPSTSSAVWSCCSSSSRSCGRCGSCRRPTAVVVERLGRYSRTLDAGLHLLIPFVDRVRAGVDLREQVVSFPPQPVITSDNLVVSIDTVIYFQVTEPKSAVYEIANYIQGIEQLTVTTLRNVVGSMDLEQTLTSRDQINGQLRGVLDEATGKLGRARQPRRAQVDRPAREHQGLDGAADARRA